MTPSEYAAEAARLRAIRTAIATGDAVQKARFGEDEIWYFQADMKLLDRMIAETEAKGSGKRTRYAKRGMFTRPY